MSDSQIHWSWNGGMGGSGKPQRKTLRSEFLGKGGHVQTQELDGKSGYLPQKKTEQTASPVPGQVARRDLPRTQDFGP